MKKLLFTFLAALVASSAAFGQVYNPKYQTIKLTASQALIFDIASQGVAGFAKNAGAGQVVWSLPQISDVQGLQAALDAKQASIGFTPENVDNKKQELTASTVAYPSNNAVLGYAVNNLEYSSNKVQSFSNITGNSQYPSAQAVLALLNGYQQNINLTQGSIPYGPAGTGLAQNNAAFFFGGTYSGGWGYGTNTDLAPGINMLAPAQANTREKFFTAKVADGGTNAFYISNGTAANGNFLPQFTGYTSGNNSALTFQGMIPPADDIAGNTTAVVNFSAWRASNDTDPVNASFTALTTRPAFSFRSFTQTYMDVLPGSILRTYNTNGNAVVNTIAPTGITTPAVTTSSVTSPSGDFNVYAPGNARVFTGGNTTNQAFQVGSTNTASFYNSAGTPTATISGSTGVISLAQTGAYYVGSNTALSYDATSNTVDINGTTNSRGVRIFTGTTANGYRLLIDAAGKVSVTGDIEFININTGPIVRTPDGTKRYRLGVSNAGAVTATLLP